MGKFDKEITAANKIGKDWIKKAEGYQASLQSIKKDSLKLEKVAMTELQNGIKQGDHLLPKPKLDYVTEIERVKDNLETFEKEGKRLFDEHEKWALKEPRSSMSFIAKELNLGKVESEAYQEVSKGIKNMLTEVASAIKETQQIWKNDLKFALDTQKSRLAALESIILDGKNSKSAYITQIRKETDDFVKLCDTIWVNIGSKIPSHAEELPKVQNGELANNEKKMLDNQYGVFKSRIVEIPKLVAAIEKNHRRILKSVPESFVKGFMISGEKKILDEKEKDLKLKLNQAFKLYEKLIAAYEKMGLVS